MFTGKKNAREGKYWLEEFQQTVNSVAGNQRLKFTAEIWMNEENSPTPTKDEIVQIGTNDEFPFLDMKMSWSPEGDLQFGMFMEKVQQLKYVGKDSIHTPSNISAIPSGVLNRLDKIMSRKTSVHSEGVDKIYPDHVNALCNAGLTPPNLPTTGDLWSNEDEKWV